MIDLMGDRRTDAVILACGDPQAFAAVFDRHFATIHRYLERRAGRDAADELAGEVFRVAFEHRQRFRPVYESALPWLYGLATNLLLKRRRSERRGLRALARLDRDEMLSGEFDDVDRRLDARSARDAIVQALARLPQRDRDVLLLIAWEDLGYEEVAVALGIPVGTVRSRLNRARSVLRELLEGCGNEQVTLICEPEGGAR